VTESVGLSQCLYVKEASAAARVPIPLTARERLEAAYQSEFSYVWNTLRRLGVAVSDREDLCHDVFVALYRSINEGKYDVARPLKSWLFGIAFRVASDFRRRARHRYEVGGRDPERLPGGPLADQQLSALKDRELVMRGLMVLDLDRRAVFILHELEGRTMPEIAEILGAPLNTCYSRLRLARETFTKTVRQAKEEP
jgi:RNA polymerase sigma-70 factor (ECF subfamily)